MWKSLVRHCENESELSDHLPIFCTCLVRLEINTFSIFLNEFLIDIFKVTGWILWLCFDELRFFLCMYANFRGHIVIISTCFKKREQLVKIGAGKPAFIITPLCYLGQTGKDWSVLNWNKEKLPFDFLIIFWNAKNHLRVYREFQIGISKSFCNIRG